MIDFEVEADEEAYWDSLSHTEEENGTSLDNESESDEDVFWDSLSQPEENIETNTSEIDVDSRKYESKSDLIWNNKYITKTVKNIPSLKKDNKKMIKLRRDFVTKFILFSIIIGRCATAKEIGGLTVQNKIQKGNLPDNYFVEQSNEKMIREKINEEVIRGYDCMEESMASAEISLNPPSECRIEDGSAYHRPTIGLSRRKHKFLKE